MGEAKTLEELQSRIAALEAEKASVTAERDAAKAEADAAKSEAETVKANFQELHDEATKLAEENKQLSETASKATAEKAKTAPVSFEIEDGQYQGKYEFTCPSFTWDDGTVYNVRKLFEDAAKDKKVAQKAEAICVELVRRGSGIVKLVNGKED